MDAPENKDRLFEIAPRDVPEGNALTLRGTGWGSCPVRVEVDGKVGRGLHAAVGFTGRDGIQPDGHGDFVVLVPTLGLKPGEHRVEVFSIEHHLEGSSGDRERRSAEFTVLARKDDETDGAHGESPFGREIEQWGKRFSHAGYIPPGTVAARRRDLQRKRDLQRVRRRVTPFDPTAVPFDGGVIPLDRPVTPGCNWIPVGPSAGYQLSSPGQLVYSGKIHAIAIDPAAPSTVYAGASGGGVWKTTDSGATWAPKSDYQSSLAIGTLTIDPHDHLHILAGTGIHPIGLMDYYGNGLLISSDGGDHWTEAGSSIFDRATISRIVFDPRDLTSQHLLLSSSLGVYESSTGGVSWTQLLVGDITDLVLIAQPGGALTALVGVRFDGIYTSTQASGSTTWPAFTKIIDPAFSPSIARIVFGQCVGTPTTIYAALETTAGADSLGAIVRTNDSGAHWTSVGKPGSPSSQTWHAFHITVHPTDPNTVFYGEVNLWRTTTGGAPWTNVTSVLHADQNAFAFDPVTPTTVWAGNDGGIWRSPDTGATWTHRNNGLATFKCIRGAQHPQWDAVFLISTQDTGAFRGDGQPVWPMLWFGDTGPLGIDPSQPLSYFVGGYHNSLARSDNAGTSFVTKINGITGQSMFYAPFVTDANNAGVCYFGSDSLWRSPDHGDTWTQVTAVLVSSFDPITGAANALSAIASHPTDPNTVYTASSDGHVFQVRRTGATWTIANVTVTDLTVGPLPAGVSISSLAVDGAGYLWAAVASVLYPADVGEFTNDHVYRYDGVAGAWASRSSGLAVANPVNAIVADLSAPNTLYCGADAGVFRTTDGTNWTLWDDGLPEVPIFDLLLHTGTRLLRAVTHGRSVWERPLDPLVCPSVDLYLRDNLVDTGRAIPAYSGVPDPFTAGVTDYWYQSDDIKVDGPTPDYQTPAVITDFVNFEAVLQHTSPRRDVVNRFYARVQNRGPLAATNVKLRAFFADAHAGLPHLPSDFWIGGRPFDVDPTVADWTPIGPSRLIASVAPGMPAIVEWDWPVPHTANDHSCLLLLATCDQQPLDGGGNLVVDTLVPGNKQVTLKNMQVENAVPGLPRPGSRPFALQMFNGYREAARYDLVVDWATLPEHSELYIAFEASEEPVLAASREELKAAGAELTEDHHELFPGSWPSRCGPAVPVHRKSVLRLVHRAGHARSHLPVLLPGRRSTLLLLRPVLPAKTAPGEYRFDVHQRTGQHLVGGSSYILHVARTK